MSRFSRLMQLLILIAVWWRWYLAFVTSIKVAEQDAELRILKAQIAAMEQSTAG